MSSNRTRFTVAATVCLLALAASASAQVQTKSQIRCIMSANGSVSKVAKAQFGNQSKCLKAASYGSLPMGQDIAGCVAADTDGKVGLQVTKAAALDAKVCPSGLTDLGYTSSAIATTAGIEGARLAFDDLMDLETPGSVIAFGADPDGSKCQGAITKGTSKLMLTMMTAFNLCKRAGLSDGSIDSIVDLQTVCFDAITADSSGKIDAASLKLADAIAARCASSTQADYLPGVCAAAPSAVMCIQRVARCRTCQAFNIADELIRGCDQFDDGSVNGTCTTLTACDDDDEDTYGENCAAGPDCNDGNPDINPGEVEICNGADDDCNFVVDDGATCDMGLTCQSGVCAP